MDIYVLQPQLDDEDYYRVLPETLALPIYSSEGVLHAVMAMQLQRVAPIFRERALMNIPPEARTFMRRGLEILSAVTVITCAEQPTQFAACSPAVQIFMGGFSAWYYLVPKEGATHYDRRN